RLSAADRDSRFKIPHMGWDLIIPDKSDPLMKGLGSSAYVYFVHSFKAVPDNEAEISALCRYGEPISAVIHRGNVWGTQFHPEKSGECGMKILKNFCSMV
ncbi:MAG: imidazole glycerol phosphate synthase subunit HisH, partial [Clostridiales bacterium]|nr:imidazole glycerol phosphate synthase subunit HisH [Clostridiales bacterium]